MTPNGAEVLAIALYLVPIGVVLVTRATRARSAQAVALDVPFAVALDLLLLLAASWVVPFGVAALVSRSLWLGAGAVLVRARRAHLCWPASLDVRRIAGALLAAGTAAWASTLGTRGYLVHDRLWHGPLVASLEGQRLPFRNVFDGRDGLHYHVAGDALSASLRALSLDVLSAQHALALEHDLLFALAAGTGALFLSGLYDGGTGSGSAAEAGRRFLPPVLGGVALLLGGPIPLRGRLGGDLAGYAYHAFLNLSFRPHVPLAALLLLGFVGLFAERAAAGAAVGAARSYPAAASLFALLSVTDEASTALLGVGAFAAWLWEPRLLAATRLRGFLALAGLAAAGVLVVVAFGGGLSPGGPVHAISWAHAAREPSVSGAFQPLLLTSAPGRVAFFFDVLPFAAPWLGLALTAWRVPSLRASAAFAAAVCVTGVVLGTHVDVNHDTAEAQRFYLAPFLVTAVFALAALHRMPRGGVAALAVLLGVAVPAVFSVYWLRERLPADIGPSAIGKQPWFDDLLRVDCRRGAGARIGESPRLAYVQPVMFFYWTACRPTFTPGVSGEPWPIKILPVTESRAQLAAIDRDLVRRDARLDAICRTAAAGDDPVCARARLHGCTPEGTDFVRCPLDAADRAALLK